VTPTDVAKTLTESDARYALDEVISLAHPSAAEKFRRRQLVKLGPVPWPELKHRAGPRAKRLRADIENNQAFALNTVYRVATLEDFQALSAMEVLRRRLAEAYRAQSPATRSHLTVVGCVRLDAETEYVVIERRGPFGDSAAASPSRVEVMTMKNTDGQWRSMLDGGLQAGELFVLEAVNFGPETV
jgi:hypothetical protein